MKTQTAKLRYLNIAPRKVRLITNALRGLTVKEAEAQLLMRTQRSATPLLKLLRSAVANAKSNELNTTGLVISEIRVDGAPVLKRMMPRAQGRATPLLKRMSHIYIVLSESDKKDRFVINKPEKTKKTVAKKKKVKKEVTEKPEKSEKSTARQKSSGGIKKFFRRKSV